MGKTNMLIVQVAIIIMSILVTGKAVDVGKRYI